MANCLLGPCLKSPIQQWKEISFYFYSTCFFSTKCLKEKNQKFLKARIPAIALKLYVTHLCRHGGSISHNYLMFFWVLCLGYSPKRWGVSWLAFHVKQILFMVKICLSRVPRKLMRHRKEEDEDLESASYSRNKSMLSAVRTRMY